MRSVTWRPGEALDAGVERLLSRRAEQAQGRRADGYPSNLTQQRTERSRNRKRWEWIRFHLNLADAALTNAEQIAQRHRKLAYELGWDGDSSSSSGG
jgi:hypothetical protein